MQNTCNLIIDKTPLTPGWPVYFVSAVAGIIPLIVICQYLFKG